MRTIKTTLNKVLNHATLVGAGLKSEYAFNVAFGHEPETCRICGIPLSPVEDKYCDQCFIDTLEDNSFID